MNLDGILDGEFIVVCPGMIERGGEVVAMVNKDVVGGGGEGIGIAICGGLEDDTGGSRGHGRCREELARKRWSDEGEDGEWEEEVKVEGSCRGWIGKWRCWDGGVEMGRNDVCLGWGGVWS